MSELSFIKTNVGLVPHTESDKETFSKWKLGEVVVGKFKRVRNPKFHRKFFALLNLAFDYYEPSSGVLTEDEKRIATKIFQTLDNYNSQNGVLLDFGREFLKAESMERRNQLANIENAFEPFRKDMIVQAGYYDEVRVPSGIQKVAKSISFAKMEEDEFNALYKAVFAACWRFVLSRTFKTESEAQNAVDQLESFIRN